jgi:hypothetical protein
VCLPNLNTHNGVRHYSWAGRGFFQRISKINVLAATQAFCAQGNVLDYLPQRLIPKTDIHSREKAQKTQNEGRVAIQHGRFLYKTISHQQGRSLSPVFAPFAPLCGYSTSEFVIRRSL